MRFFLNFISSILDTEHGILNFYVHNYVTSAAWDTVRRIAAR